MRLDQNFHIFRTASTLQDLPGYVNCIVNCIAKVFQDFEYKGVKDKN